MKLLKMNQVFKAENYQLGSIVPITVVLSVKLKQTIIINQDQL